MSGGMDSLEGGLIAIIADEVRENARWLSECTAAAGRKAPASVAAHRQAQRPGGRVL